MQYIRKNFLLGNAIIEIDRDEIDFNELHEYRKTIINRFNKSEYCLEQFSDEDIISFCKTFSVYVQYKPKNKIVLVDREKHKSILTKFFRSSLSSEVIEKLRCDYKLILPVLSENKIIEYNFLVTNNFFMKAIKNEMSIYNNKIILDLNLLYKLLNQEQLDEFFNELYNNCTKKTIINSDNYFNLLNSLNIILNNDSKNILKYLLKDKELITDLNYINILNKYYDIALKNNEILNLYEFDKKLNKRI